MNQKPLFSVLIANYNNGCYLNEAIQSVFAQSYSTWEIILVDDGSTDNSHEVYSQFAGDNRIKIYFNENNRGCGYTKRRCAELATGELCGFLDPDDALTPDALEIMVREHQNNPEAALVASCYWACDENLKPQWRTDKRIIKEGFSYLTNVDHAPLHFACHKNSFYKQTIGIDADLKRAVDLDLFLKLEEVGAFVYLNDVTYYYRIHNQSISTHGDYKGLFWHALVITRSCNRRGIEPEIVVNDLLMKHGHFYFRNSISTKNEKSSGFFNLLHKIKRQLNKF